MVVLSENGVPELWERVVGHMRAQLIGHVGPVLATAFSPTGRRIVTAGADGAVRIWDGRSGQSLLVLRGHQQRVSAVSFSPDGQYVLTGSRDGSARLFRSQITELPQPLSGHLSEVVSLSFSQDGQRLLSGSRDGTAAVWDLKSSDRLAELKSRGLSEARWLKLPSGNSELLTITPGGVGSTGRIPGLLRYFSGEGSGGDADPGGDLALGTILAVTDDGENLLSMPQSGQASLWQRHSGSPMPKSLGELPQQQDEPTVAVFSPDGRWLATGSKSGQVMLYDVRAKLAAHALPSHQGAVRTLQFSRSSELLASGSADTSARLYDPVTQQVVATMTGHSGEVRAVLFAGDGSRLLVLDSGERAWLRDGKDGRLGIDWFGEDGSAIDISAAADSTTRTEPSRTPEPETEQPAKQPTGIKANGRFIPVEPTQALELREQLLDALAAARPHIEHPVEDEVHKIPADYPTLAELEALASQNDGDQIAGPGAPSDRKSRQVLIVASNEEEIDHAAQFRVRPLAQAKPEELLRTTLKAHQVEGLSWLQKAWAVGNPGVLLADDMGLGKTLQALAFLAWLRAGMASGSTKQPLLVVAPTGLLHIWSEHDRHLGSHGLGELTEVPGRAQTAQTPRWTWRAAARR